MKKFLYTLISSLIIAIQLPANAENNTAHFIAWGDEEGFLRRPEVPVKSQDVLDKDPNVTLPILMRNIELTDSKDKIDALLHVGDFVRFDPSPKYYQNFLGKYLNIFYPTSGGDQEFFFNRYYNFVVNTPHLKKLYVERAKKDGNGLELYYHTTVKNTHIISLYSPDEYREPEKTPQFDGQNFFKYKNTQFIWLNNILEEIREKNKDNRPIIIISHGPMFNQSKMITDMFEKYKVNLVLNGDAHVLAHKYHKGTHYIISGIMGDAAVGGCYSDKEEEEAKLKNPNYIEKYEICLPKQDYIRKKADPFKFIYDHYLDIHISEKSLKVDFIELETGNIIYQIK
ncbi:MAG: metallophosphoesterase [Candidatus Sericytochromatia bacterium]